VATTSPAWKPGPPGALLWDLDNVAPRRQHLAAVAEVLCRLVDGDEPVVAAGHRAVFRSSRALLTDLGIQVLSGGRRPNGADRVLLARAQMLAQQGVGRFVVATNDHRFAGIARFGDLHVVTLTDDLVSDRLRAVAGSLTVLRCQDGTWSTRTKQVPPPGNAT
jgi:hypothetical protein